VVFTKHMPNNNRKRKMETIEQQIARKMAALNEDGIAVALSKLPAERVKAAEALVNEMREVFKKSAVPVEKDVKSNGEAKFQRDTAKTFMADVIATLEAYDKKEHIEVRISNEINLIFSMLLTTVFSA
jgi:hypothetical protein